MVADDILMNISEIESPNYEYVELDLLNLPRDYINNISLRLSKHLADSDLGVIGRTGIGPIRKISALDWFLSFWPNENFYIVLTDLTILRLINQLVGFLREQF
jgi:hypothetical protein